MVKSIVSARRGKYWKICNEMHNCFSTSYCFIQRWKLKYHCQNIKAKSALLHTRITPVIRGALFIPPSFWLLQSLQTNYPVTGVAQLRSPKAGKAFWRSSTQRWWEGALILEQLKKGTDVQSICYSVEEIADTLKMRICCSPPGKRSLKQELVAITEKQKQSYIRSLQGRGGQGALQPPHRTANEGKNCWGTLRRMEEMGNQRRRGKMGHEMKRR